LNNKKTNKSDTQTAPIIIIVFISNPPFMLIQVIGI